MSVSVPISGQAKDGPSRRNIPTFYAPSPTAECLEHVESVPLHPLSSPSQESSTVTQQCRACCSLSCVP